MAENLPNPRITNVEKEKLIKKIWKQARENAPNVEDDDNLQEKNQKVFLTAFSVMKTLGELEEGTQWNHLWPNQQKQLIDFLEDDVIRPRGHGGGRKKKKSRKKSRKKLTKRCCKKHKKHKKRKKRNRKTKRR